MSPSSGRARLNIRRLSLDVDKARSSPSLIELAEAIAAVDGVEAFHITVTEIDLETVGMDVAIEGKDLDYAEILKAIHDAGAVIHSIDELAGGDRLIARPERHR
jgi:hypothetical protein